MTGKTGRPRMKDFKGRFMITARTIFGRDLEDLSKGELYQTLAATVKQYISENWIKTNREYKDRGVRQVYYFSVEFLLGRLLNSNLVNLGIRQDVEKQLKELGFDLDDLINEERDAGLGNGASAGWLRASSIPWPLWACRDTAALSATATACSSSIY